VYSNFSSKEDLFFAVYERRAERGVAEVEQAFAAAGDTKAAILRLVAATSRRRGGAEDGWLAVFFEFWAHVLRNPEHRERFAEIHARVQEPIVAEIESYAERRGTGLPVSARQLAIGMFAMTTGLSLERLVQPDAVDPRLNELMADLTFSRLVDEG
jgi:AcrR family transcriptional regulator